jgi:hypothetical protein
MRRLANARAHSVGLRSDERLDLPSVNHFKTSSISKTAAATIVAHNLERVAGNVFISKSEKEFWTVEDGKIRRITTVEVDNGDSIPGASSANPATFLDEILTDLSF